MPRSAFADVPTAPVPSKERFNWLPSRLPLILLRSALMNFLDSCAKYVFSGAFTTLFCVCVHVHVCVDVCGVCAGDGQR